MAGRTKWSILHAQMDRALVEAGRYRDRARAIEREIDALTATPFLKSDGSMGACAGCGLPLPTEAAFAHHFLIPDERYLNLGQCPNAQD